MLAGILALAIGVSGGYCPPGQAVVTTSGIPRCGIVSAGGGGAGLPADPAACPAGTFATDQNASGVLVCTAVGWGVLTGKPATFAPTAHTHPGGEVTSAVANATAATTATTANGVAAGAVGPAGLAPGATTPSSSLFYRGDGGWFAPPAQDWTVITSKPATFPATVPVSMASALAADPADCVGAGEFSKGIDASGVASGCAVPPGTYSLPVASTTLGGVKQAAPCGAGNHVASIVAGELTCTADAGGGAHTLNSATHTDVDPAATAANDVLIRDGTNTTWLHRALATTDLPAHLLMGAQHSDVDTAGTTAGDIVVRNAANTQWGHQAIGGATTVLHGGTTAPAFSGVALADFVANLGTTATVLHGNAAGQPTYGAVALGTDVSGTLGVGNGGLGAAVTPAAGTIPYGSSGTAHAELAAGTAGAVLRSGGAGAPVWVSVQTCTSSAATTCTITVARSGCTPVCGMGASAAGSTWVRAAVSTTTLTCTFSTSGTNICNCLCP